MTKPQPNDSRFLPWMLLLFAGSGCAALIYEIVWLQLLQLVIGSSAVSLGLLLAAYMGGLCLGSAALPRVMSAKHDPLRVYALLELGIGVLGFVVLLAVPFVGRVYLAGATQGIAGLVLRGLIAAVCLVPPAMLMGASLPAAGRWIETTPRGVSRLGFLYSANIAGAVLGCLVAGFYLLRVHDMAIATYAAASMNFAVALISLILVSRVQHRAAESAVVAHRSSLAPGATLVYLAIALSGLCALGAEVVWTRLLSLLLGGTVYTFSIILAVFLLGLWAGSTSGSFLARRTKHPRMMLGACQILSGVAIAWTSHALCAFAVRRRYLVSPGPPTVRTSAFRSADVPPPKLAQSPTGPHRPSSKLPFGRSSRAGVVTAKSSLSSGPARACRTTTVGTVLGAEGAPESSNRLTS